jgi:hypothetical protein
MSLKGKYNIVRNATVSGAVSTLTLLLLFVLPMAAQTKKKLQENPASEQKASLMARLERLQAVRDAQNLMSKYTYYQSADMQEETVALFAKRTLGTRVEMMWGVYDGLESIKKCFLLDHLQKNDNRRSGVMDIDTLTTPIIQVAGDGNTAKGIWMSPGLETAIVDGKPSAKWAWFKYGTDFVKEDGAWRIWHLHVYGILETDYHQSWAESTPVMYDASYSGLVNHKMHNDRPPTTYWVYSKDTVFPEDQPSIPQPYETFDEKSAY